ncbi:uncharacterized protein LOC125740321 [Brienomyrus brachyistius]|uniref:uncharacterized protein LOC125740321 n=1 Tax=Brienomyrus brachyistius TaxID=42636 RepID=UPI0020B198D5|nr:uncharacterized protein LOC125740321 [Brienomyrus brachyistius]
MYMITDGIILGPEGVAIPIRKMGIVGEWYNIPDTEPHIAMTFNQSMLDLGEMMQQARQVVWVPTVREGMQAAAGEKMLRIQWSAKVVGDLKLDNRDPWLWSMIGVQCDAKESTEECWQEMEREVPEEVWTAHDTEVGLVNSASPVEIYLKPGCTPPWKNQYPLKPEAEEGIRETIEGLLDAGVLVPTISCCNTPLLPVPKAGGEKWRLVHDLRAVNEVVEDQTAEVPNPHTLLTNVPPNAKWFTVVDLCSAFFSVPLAEQSQFLFAFTYRGQQYAYTRMPQGFKHSPHVFNQVLKADLDGLNLKSTVIQYVDDLLLCAETLADCHQDSVQLLKVLAKGGHKVSKAKLQYCQEQVTYLGREISHGRKAIAAEQLKGITKAPKPMTVSQMLTFLGMTGFSMDWIEDYAVKVAPLRALIKEEGHTNLKASLIWTNEVSVAFESIKQELQNAPALGLPDYTKPFYLYVRNRKDGFGTALLTQDLCPGRRKQPLAYYSMKLDNVAQGCPPCFQGVVAAYLGYEKATAITMGYPVTIYTSHKVVDLIDKGKFVLTPARQLAYFAFLTYPDVTIKRCTTVNPADSIPLEDEGQPHECVAESLVYTKLRPDLESSPIENSEMVLFVDGSCWRDGDALKAGFAVVQAQGDDFYTLVSEPAAQPCSAQLAELKALTEACRRGQHKTVTIYTDSAYAHGVCHLFGAVWKQRGFRKSDGSPIQHYNQILELLHAMMRPKRLAIIKCQAHRKGRDFVIQGNAAADAAARAAAQVRAAHLLPMVTVEPYCF